MWYIYFHVRDNRRNPFSLIETPSPGLLNITKQSQTLQNGKHCENENNENIFNAVGVAHAHNSTMTFTLLGFFWKTIFMIRL